MKKSNHFVYVFSLCTLSQSEPQQQVQAINALSRCKKSRKTYSPTFDRTQRPQDTYIPTYTHIRAQRRNRPEKVSVNCKSKAVTIKCHSFI